MYEKIRTYEGDEDHENKIVEYLDKQEQTLNVLRTRLSRYIKSNKWKQDNRLFQINEEQFYNQLQQDTKVKGNSYPTKEQIEEFWKNLWADRQQYNESADWIQKELERVATVPIMDVPNITIEDVRTTIKRTNNWKAAGADHIQNYWYKQLSAAHDTLKRNFNDIIQDPNKIPEFMTKGKF
jgi:hypothetical protein